MTSAMQNPTFTPKNSDFEARVRASFARQGAMTTMGATMTRVAPGEVEIELPWAPGLTQQHGFLHGGVVASVLDSACGFAGFSLMPADCAVLTVEFKINFVAPAKGQRFRMHGVVIKPGRTITLVEGRAWSLDHGRDQLIATMSCTLMALAGRENIQD